MFHRRALLSVRNPFAGGGPATYDGFAATRGQSPTTLSGNTAINARSGHWARTDITQLKILCPNYYGSTESAPGATMGITASVEYPAGTLTQILFSASSSGTIPDGGTLVSDYLTISIPNGERFWIRVHLTNASGVPVVAGTLVDIRNVYMGDAYEVTATDRTMTGVITPVQNLAYIPGIIAPMTAPSVLILGDSIDFGSTDDLDVDGDLGAIARTIGPEFGYFNASIPGEAASGFVSNHTQRLLLSYCTHVFVGFGTNDLFANDTAATIEGNLDTIYGLCSTKTVFGRTMVPRTTDVVDFWTTTTNQAVIPGDETERLTLNTDLLASAGPPGGVFDVGAEVDNGAGLWVANSTEDGIHPDYSGYVDIATSGVIDTTLVGTPATPTTETGSGWGDVGTKITISTRRRANDTAEANTNGNPATVVRSASGNSSGLKYFELELLGANDGFIQGLMTNDTASGAGLDAAMGVIPDSFGLPSNGGGEYTFVGGTIFLATSIGDFAGLSGAGDVFGWAVDFTNKFAYVHRNGVWCLSADPTTPGTGECVEWTGTPTLYFGANLFGYDPSATTMPAKFRLRTNSFLYTPPSGFSAWG